MDLSDPKNRKPLLYLTVGAMLALLCVAAYVMLTKTQTHRIPNVALKYIDGSRANLEDYRGNPVLVTFWATS